MNSMPAGDMALLAFASFAVSAFVAAIVAQRKR